MARKRYLKKLPLDDARKLFLGCVDAAGLATEATPVADALDRVTAEPIFAAHSSPRHHVSAMDGICVRAADTFGATEFAAKQLSLAAESNPGGNAFSYVDTGNALPAWA